MPRRELSFMQMLSNMRKQDRLMGDTVRTDSYWNKAFGRLFRRMKVRRK